MNADVLLEKDQAHEKDHLNFLKGIYQIFIVKMNLPDLGHHSIPDCLSPLSNSDLTFKSWIVKVSIIGAMMNHELFSTFKRGCCLKSGF